MKSTVSAFKAVSPGSSGNSVAASNLSEVFKSYDCSKELFFLPKNLIEETILTLESVQCNLIHQNLKSKLLAGWRKLLNPEMIIKSVAKINNARKSFIKINPKSSTNVKII